MAATTTPPRRPRTRIRFELDSLDMADGHVVVSGRWHDVRGLRFVRPTLIVDGDEVLSTLEHKPWPADADPWVAEFPWEEGRIDPRRAALSVAPSVTVPLAWPADTTTDPAPVPDESVAELQDRLRNLVEHEALHGRLEEAVSDRETALHSYRRMQDQLDAAKAAGDEMEAERDRAVGDSDRAVAARDEAVAARDEALAERNALREQIRKLKTERRREMAAARREQQADRPRRPDPDDDRPIGTRALTAADLLTSSSGGRSKAHHAASPADRAAVRLFGTGAFICAFLLVVNLLGLLL